VLPDAVHRVSDVHVACLDGWVAWPLGLETAEPSSSLSSKGAIEHKIWYPSLIIPKQSPIVTPAMLFSAQIPVAQLDTHSPPAKSQQGALSGPDSDKMVGMQIPKERMQMPDEVVGFERQGVCCATSRQYGERQSAETLSTNSDKTVSRTPRRLSWRDRFEL
jgi:hypothetical protein